MSAQRYRKKPVEIDALRFDGTNAHEVLNWIQDHGVNAVGGSDGLVILTLEGNMTASPGDYVIKGVAGEFYPCKSDIFAATYEGVADDGSGIPVSEVRGDEAP